MNERFDPCDIRTKGTKAEIRGTLRLAGKLVEVAYRSDLVGNGGLKRDALVMKARGLILQNPLPGDLKRSK